MENKSSDSNKLSPKWKIFEEFVANLQRELAPNAQIKHNDKIMGSSGIERQVDVSIRATIGQFHLLMAIDCKDWKTAVDIQDVEKFIGAIEDIKANKGAIVSNHGFTKAAKTRALQKGIDLYSAIDVESVEWPVFLALPTLCDFRGPKRFSLTFKHSSPNPFAMPAVDPRYIPLYRKDGTYIDLVFNLLNKAWNEGRLPVEPGEYPNTSFLTEDVYTKVETELYGPVNITAKLLVERRLYFGHLPLVKGRGFKDEIKGSFTTRSITTDSLDAVEVERTWQRLTDESELAIKPTFKLTALDQFPLINPDPKT